jgi:hypothetical protein
LDHLVHSTPGVSQANVIISDPFGRIVKVMLESTKNSFEAANFYDHAVSAVPLPATSVLFAIALAGLVLVGRRRNQGTI